MRATVRYGVAVLMGIVAGGGTYLAVRPVAGQPHVSLIAGTNAVAWAVAVAVTLDAHADLGDRLPVEGRDVLAAAKLGALAGGVSSLAVGGTFLALTELVPFRYAAAVALFVFGTFLAGVGIGERAVAARVALREETNESRKTTESVGD